MRYRLKICFCLCAVLAVSQTGRAEGLNTDANIITGIDMSESVTPADMRLQITGMAQAIRSPEVLAAIRGGANGRIGFAVFAWHHRQIDIVPWTIIGTAQEAAAVARRLEFRLTVDPNAEARHFGTAFIGRLTDSSGAIDHAVTLALNAPFTSNHPVINIVGNGADNMGEPADQARDRAVAIGATVNGVVVGGGSGSIRYFGREIIGGHGAFLMTAASNAAFGQLMRRKFVRDMMVASLAGAR